MTPKIEETTIIKITPPSKRARAEIDYWNLEKHPRLKAAIEKVLETREPLFVRGADRCTVYHIQPSFPFIPKAMAKPGHANILQVSIAVYHAAFHLAVRDVDKCPYCKSEMRGGLCQNYGCESPKSRHVSKKVEPGTNDISIEAPEGIGNLNI